MNFKSKLSEIKCQNHAQLPVSIMCVEQACQEHPIFCNRCITKHLAHSKMVIYADQLEVMLKRHSFVNEICQDKEGLEAYRVFLTFKKAIETKLEDLENLLRQQILRNLNAQNLNEEAEKFIKEAGDFAMNDLLILRKRILERMQNLQQNTVVIKEAPQRKELLQLTAYLKDKIPNLQREILNHLEATYTTFELGKEIVVPRLSKVLIDHEGQARPANFNSKIMRVTRFTLKDKPVYLVGLHQPVMYQGSHNSTNYNSQNGAHTLIYKIHEGTNLTQSILEHTFEVSHEQQLKELEIVDGHCYNIQFKRPLKLEENKSYSISITTHETKQVWTYQYSNPVLENEYMVFQNEDLNDSAIFQKNPYIQQIFSHYSIDQVPALVIKTKK